MVDVFDRYCQELSAACRFAQSFWPEDVLRERSRKPHLVDLRRFFTDPGYIIGVTIVGTFGVRPPVHQAGCSHHDSLWDGDRPIGRWRRATVGVQYHLAGALWIAVRGSRWGAWSRPWCWESPSSVPSAFARQHLKLLPLALFPFGRELR
jgi:hypothetical protein